MQIHGTAKKVEMSCPLQLNRNIGKLHFKQGDNCKIQDSCKNQRKTERERQTDADRERERQKKDTDKKQTLR